MTKSPLFQPFTFKGLTLPNRIVMAPMTRGFSPGGVPTQDVAGYYKRRAAGDVGLILSEGAGINRPASLNGTTYPSFHGQAALAGWKAVIDAVHGAGGRMGPQIWHVGAVPQLRGSDHPAPDSIEGPSGLKCAGKPLGKAMSEADIADTLAAYGAAAADAERLGFDVVEIHGAHGYLIDQFFWHELNQRDDGWGGDSIAARNRFAVEVVRAIRAAVSPDFPVILRLSQWKQQDYAARIATTPDEMAQWLQPLVDAGVDMLHCSQRRYWEAEFDGSDLNFAGWAKKLTGVPTITVGSVGLEGDFVAALGGQGSSVAPLNDLERRLDRGDFDLVAVGRALLQDADWVAKLRDGRVDEIRPYDGAALMSLN